LITTIFDIFAFIVMLRFIMQYTRASFNNPVGDLIVKATNPLLMPLRKFIPGVGGHDIAAIVLVFLILLALSGLLHSVTSPILNPIQRFIPPFNGLDLSPLVAILILYFIKIVLGL